MGKGIDWTVEERREQTPLEYFWSSSGFSMVRVLALAQGVVCVVAVVYVLFLGAFGIPEPRVVRSVALTLFFIYAFLRFPVGRKWNERPNWLFSIDSLLILLVIASQVYILWGTYWSPTREALLGGTCRLFIGQVRVDYLVGLVVHLVVLEATRRTMGWAIVILILVFGTYVLTASHWPGLLKAASMPWTHIIDESFMDVNEGLYAVGGRVLFSMIFPFLLFGSLMKATKVGVVFTSLSNAILGHQSGGPAKVAVASSALVGSISGSAIANVATTGSVTIPLMKRLGFKPEFAGAIEACASTGGQLMPPVMGITVFVMAAMIRVPYIQLCIYAIIPALLYFFVIYLVVHWRSKAMGLQGLPRSELPSTITVLKQGGVYFAPLLFIIVTLLMGYSITRVALVGIMMVALVSFIRKETRLNLRGFLTAFEEFMRSSVGILITVMVIGILLLEMNISALGVRFSDVVEVLSGGHLMLALLIAAIVAIILGMGMPTLLIYLTLSAFVLPALIEMGGELVSCNLFVFYFGVAAIITPPFCLGAYAAAGIAGSSPMKTGWAACRLGAAAYIIPFAFIWHPGLLLLGGESVGAILWSIFSVGAGLACFASGIEGWFLKKANRYQRVLLSVAGGLLVAPSGLLLQLVGLGLAGLVVFWQKR